MTLPNGPRMPSTLPSFAAQIARETAPTARTVQHDLAPLR